MAPGHAGEPAWACGTRLVRRCGSLVSCACHCDPFCFTRVPYLHPPHTTVHTLVSGTPPFHHHQKYAGSPPVHCGVKKAATNFLKRYKPFPSNPGCENVFTDQSPLRKFKPSVAKEFEFRLPPSRWPHSPPPNTTPPTTIHHAKGRQKR